MACIIDTSSINLSIVAAQLSADIVVDPGAGIAPNPLVVNAAGVYVVGSDGWIPLPTTLAFSSADGHTFVATTSADLRTFIGPGDRIRLVQSGVPAYYIVTAITAGTITLYGGQLSTLAASAITFPYFSKAKSPIGFTLDPTQWAEVLRDTSLRSQVAAGAGTWYNPGGLTLAIPIGIWSVEFDSSSETNTGSPGGVMSTTLSTANNSETDLDFSSNASPSVNATYYRRKVLSLAVKTSYFANIKTDTGGAPTISLKGTITPTIIRATSAYL